MATRTTPQPDQQSGLPVPFTKEQLREDIAKVVRHQIHMMSHFTSGLIQLRSGGTPLEYGDDIGDPELSCDELGLTWQGVEDSVFAQAVEQEYEYGFFGRLTPGYAPMDYESSHMWVAALLSDLDGAQTVVEWESYGGDLAESVRRCLHACELANARRTLEGHRHFAFFGPESTSFDGLTIRQMALLSGMEEMSVRTAASRKGPNMLETFKDDNNRTFVKLDDAKKWLIAKGRYLPITTGGSEVDLSVVRFDNSVEFTLFLTNRLNVLQQARDQEPQPAARLDAVLKKHKLACIPVLARKAMDDEEIMGEVAELVGLPQNLLVLHAKQLLLLESLYLVKKQLSEAQASALKG